MDIKADSSGLVRSIGTIRSCFYSTESQIPRRHARNLLNLDLHSCRIMCHFPSQVVFKRYQNDPSSSILFTGSSVSLT